MHQYDNESPMAPQKKLDATNIDYCSTQLTIFTKQS